MQYAFYPPSGAGSAMYSPTPRAKAAANPASSAGSRAGKTTRRSVWPRVAPSVAAASSASSGRSIMTGSNVRTTKGSSTKIIASTTPSGVYATLMPTGRAAHRSTRSWRTARSTLCRRRPWAAPAACRSAHPKIAARKTVANHHPRHQRPS